MQKRQFKENVKNAACYLQQQGFDVPHTQLLEAISRGFGERNWSTMRALLEDGAPASRPLTEQETPSQSLSAVADLLSKDIHKQMWDGVFGMFSREQAEIMLAETAARLTPDATPAELAEALDAIWVD